MTIHNSDLVVGGFFSTAGSVSANNIARWDGLEWHAYKTGMNGSVRALVVYNGLLYAGGSFTYADGSPIDYLAKWEGGDWVDAGANLNAMVYTLAVDDYTLYVGGSFTNAGYYSNADYIARYSSGI